ncbi:hypothetical protein J2X69_003037 [Algoriphagus sp. 4150]|uniref:hypothetical protein n=1 Tax=Algoriphagus sp. 4150 TaxID=2817756 RepID=UPI00285A5EBB|nr:hypothetical protein [Algoriphagus sp. 4150]MDR7130680.1 hypothetical protein [Algoriphagus sp. 4150]
MTRIDLYEKNEYEVGNSLMNYYNINDFELNPTINKFSDLDLIIKGKNNKKIYCEIKCREKIKIGYLIEEKKLSDLLKKIKYQNQQARYINYIEKDEKGNGDILIIFNLNKRIKTKLKKIYESIDTIFSKDFYRSMGFQKNSFQGTYKKKYYTDLFPDPDIDIIIFNYSEKLKNYHKPIPFNYEKVNRD